MSRLEKGRKVFRVLKFVLFAVAAITAITLISDVSFAQPESDGGYTPAGLGFNPADPMFKIAWGLAFVGSIVALVQAWLFFKSMMKADEGNWRSVLLAIR